MGNAADDTLKSGVTVLTSDKPFIASVDVRGGAPGTRETELLAPDKLVDAIDAIVLSGGSAFGLDSSGGVMDELHKLGRGFSVGGVSVPLVSGAIVFDLLNGGDKNWSVNPYTELGRHAYRAAASTFELGTYGAGSGATTADLKGGLGSASVLLPDGTTVGALVVVNARGSVVNSDGGHFWAAPFEQAGEFGNAGMCTTQPTLVLNSSGLTDESGASTTIAIVATDAPLNCSQLQRLATVSHDGIARAVVPAHTLFDGDLVFALSTGEAPGEAIVENRQTSQVTPAKEAVIGHAAALCLSRAIARGVYEAQPEPNDLLPCWQEKYSAS